MSGYRGPGPLWNERGGASGWEEVWRRRDWERELGDPGEDPKEPETGPLKCKSLFICL